MKYKLLHRMSSCRIILLLLGIIAGIECYGQVSITSLPYMFVLSGDEMKQAKIIIIDK